MCYKLDRKIKKNKKEANKLMCFIYNQNHIFIGKIRAIRNTKVLITKVVRV